MNTVTWTRLFAFHIAYLTILPPAMDQIVVQTRLFSLGMAVSLGEGKVFIKNY